MPTKGLAFIFLKDKLTREGIDLAKKLVGLNFTLCGTEGTASVRRHSVINCTKVKKVSAGSPHIVDILNSKSIALVINTGGGKCKYRCED